MSNYLHGNTLMYKIVKQTGIKLFVCLAFMFCTIANIKAQNGPGGVGATNGTSNLVLWLKANSLTQANGSIVTSWPDQSGYGNNATAPANREPNFTTGVYNNYPAISFTSTQFDHLRVADATSLKPSTISIFIVGKYYDGVTGGYEIFLAKNSSWDWIDGYAITLNSNRTGSFTYLSNWSAYSINGALTASTPVIFNSIYNKVDFRFYQNELLQGTPLAHTADIQHSNHFLGIGACANGNGLDPNETQGQGHLNGDIAEVIILNKNANAAERILINNYLSAKYNIPLGANDLYDEDDAANGNYDADVAGIGRVDANNIQNTAKGNMVSITTPTANLTDGAFLIWGHDNQALVPTATTNIPTGVYGRLGRTWRASKTGTVGAVTVQFDLTGFKTTSASDLRLLVDTDNDGSFADETSISGAVAAGNNIFEFQNITQITNNTRFTLAILPTANCR